MASATGKAIDSDRKGVDDALREAGVGPTNDDEWQLAKDYVGGFAGEADFAFGAEYVERIRASQVGASGALHRHPTTLQPLAPVDVPEHWRRYCKRLFASYEGRASQARDILGLEAAVPRQALEGYLKTVSESERREGDTMRLQYLAADGEPRVLVVYRGYANRELRRLLQSGALWRIGVPRASTGVAEAGQRTQEAPANESHESSIPSSVWIAERVNRLARIVEMAADLARKSGCPGAEATTFLLSGSVPELPWLEAGVVDFDRGRHTFHLLVGSPLVPAEDVRRFYLQVRSEVAAPPHPRGKRQRGRNPWTYELLSFVERGRRQWISWPTIFKAWNEDHPEHPYKSLAGMQRSFYQARGTQPREGSITVSPRVFRPRSPR